jgi:hypothetical protein
MRTLLVVALTLLTMAGLALAAESQTGTAGSFTVTLAANPSTPVVGENELTVSLTKDGKPVVGAGVDLHLDMTTMAMPSDVTAKAGAKDGEYLARANLGMAGEWKVTVKVQQMAGMDMAGDGQTDFTLTVAGAEGSTASPPPLPQAPPAPSSPASGQTPWLVIGAGILGLLVVILVVRFVLRTKG